MAILRGGYIDQQQLASDIERARLKLGPEVVRLRYNVGEDSGGDPAIFFRIVLTDETIRRETLGPLVRSIKESVMQECRSIDDWGLFPYFSFRSESEEDQIKDPTWA